MDLTIFGQTFTNVAGIKATNTSGTTEVFEQGGGQTPATLTVVCDAPVPGNMYLFYEGIDGVLHQETFDMSGITVNSFVSGCFSIAGSYSGMTAMDRCVGCERTYISSNGLGRITDSSATYYLGG